MEDYESAALCLELSLFIDSKNIGNLENFCINRFLFKFKI
jgi:hypothetical protein